MYKLFKIPLLIAGLGLAVTPGRGDVYKESGGVVLIEGTHFDYRNFEFTDAAIPHHFHIVPDEDGVTTAAHPWGDGHPATDYQNSRTGTYLELVPDSGQNNGNCPTCPNENVGFPPYAEYKVEITTLGTYQLYLRQMGFDGGSDSFFAQILEFAPPGPGPNFYRYAPNPDNGDFDQLLNDPNDTSTTQGWSGFAAPAPRVDGGGGEVKALYNITTPGLYTIRLSMREDGAGVDGVCLQLASLPPPTRDSKESAKSTSNPPYVRAVNPTPGQQQVPPDNEISVQIVDGATTVNGSSIKMVVNGATVTPVISKTNQVTYVTYTGGPLLPSGAAVNWSVSFSDTGSPAKSFTNSFPFTVLPYSPIPASYAVPDGSVDKTKLGFKVRTAQTDGVGSLPQNSIARAEAALAGTLIDPASGSPYPNLATPGPNPDKSYDEPGVINYDKAGDTGVHGDFDTPNFPDALFPGLPGSGGSDDNTALEAVTWLDLQPGVYRMVVNSDDNFRVTTAPDPHDQAGIVLGQFDDPGGRGAADTLFIFVVEKAGIYPFRLVWENGGGDSNLEWFTQNVFGRRALINDVKNANAVKGYRSGPSYPYISSFSSDPFGFKFSMKDNGGIVVNKDTVKLKLDGNAISPTVSKTADLTSVSYTSSTIFPSASSHSIDLSYNDGSGATHSRTLTFDTETYASLTAAMAAGAPDTTKPGFNVRVNQIDGGGTTVEPNTIAFAEQQLAGTVTNSSTGKPYPNSAAANTDGTFVYVEPGVINYDATGTGNNGNFTPDNQMPGFPGTGPTGGSDNAAAEITTYLVLPAGLITMGVNSDDGFRLSPAKNVQDANNAVTLGVFDAGRGAADTLFDINVEQAGTFPMRLIWENGNGGANVEWFSVSADGTKHLINDSTDSKAIKAYRVAAGGNPPTQPKASISITGNNVTISSDGGGTVQATDKLGPASWADVGPAPQTVQVTGNARFFRIKK